MKARRSSAAPASDSVEGFWSISGKCVKKFSSKLSVASSIFTFGMLCLLGNFP